MLNLLNTGRIALKSKSKTNIIEINRILYLTCDGYITYITVDGDVKYAVAKCLNLFDKELNDFGFVRINRNTTINGNRITKISIINGVKFVFIDDLRFKISRRKGSLFKF